MFKKLLTILSIAIIFAFGTAFVDIKIDSTSPAKIKIDPGHPDRIILSQSYYGISWDESQATGGYARTGALESYPTGQTLSEALLPIQATMERCVINDAGVVQYYLNPSDSTKKADGSVSDLTGADGQVVVEIDKFYHRYFYSGTTHTWDISLHHRPGFNLHPAFIKNGEEVSHRYMSAYEGVLYDVSASRYTNGLQLPAGTITFDNASSVITYAFKDHPFTLLEAGDKFVIAGTVNNNGTFTVSAKTDQTITTVESLTDETAAATTLETQKDWANDVLSSVSGKAPINYGTRANFRAAAATRGTGWRQQDYDLISAIQLLYLVEYASFNSQSMIGAGLTNFGSTNWLNWSDYNPIEVTGLSNGLGNASGGVNNGANGLGSYMSYRGIENFYGHLWKWMDGININSNIPYVSNNDTQFADNTSVNYTGLGIVLSISNGYQKTLEQISRGFLPASIGGGSTTYITDYYYQNTGWRVAGGGGLADAGSDGGFASWAFSYSSGVRHRVISGRLSW